MTQWVVWSSSNSKDVLYGSIEQVIAVIRTNPMAVYSIKPIQPADQAAVALAEKNA